MFKIGLTGGICTVKTYVLKIFEELSCFTLRADDIAKEIIFSDNDEINKKIENVFGKGIFLSDNSINKENFSKLLFSDSKKREFINNVIHPLVIEERKKIFKELEDTEVYKFLIYESALLVESNSYEEFDKIIVVYANPVEQLRRLIERDKLAEDDAKMKIKAQFPLSEKLKIANYTIDTSGSFESTRKNTLETFYLLEKDLSS
jgi:dephospho-CoA kinase